MSYFEDLWHFPENGVSWSVSGPDTSVTRQVARLCQLILYQRRHWKTAIFHHDFLILLLLLGSSEFRGEALLVLVLLAVPLTTGEPDPCILLLAIALLLKGVLSSVCSMVAGLAGMSYCVGVIPRRSSIIRSWVSASWHSLCLIFIWSVWPCFNWSCCKIQYYVKIIKYFTKNWYWQWFVALGNV